jgi:hypothetical protein
MENKSVEKSGSINEWAKAFAKFQAKKIKAEKNAVNPHFRNRYANLESLVSAIGEHLSECGLCFTQLVSDGESGPSVTTMLIHESGQYVSETLTLKMQRNDMQGMGSAITYAKRYCLSAMLGIPDSDGDDDGEAAGRAPEKRFTPSKPLNKFVPPRKTSSPIVKPSVPLKERIHKMITSFMNINVTEEMISKKLGKGIQDINTEDMANLAKWYPHVEKGKSFMDLE